MIDNLLWYLAYFVTDITMFLVAGFVYTKVTPYDEFKLIREGNASAACALTGAAIGYALIFYAVTVHGSTILQVVIWSSISLLVQIGTFEALRFASREDWAAAIERDDLAHGIMLGGLSLVVGIINAGCLSP